MKARFETIGKKGITWLILKLQSVTVMPQREEHSFGPFVVSDNLFFLNYIIC